MRVRLFAGVLAMLPLSVLCVEPKPYSVDTPLPVAMTYCYPGESCITCDSEMPLATVNELLELKLTEGEVLLFTPDPKRPESRDWKWSATGMIWPALVEKKYSGKGNRNQPPACAHRVALKGSHQPKDGFWTVTQSKEEMENCPAVKVPEKTVVRQKIRFENPFRGRLTDDEDFSSLVQISPNSFASYHMSGNSVAETLMDVHSPTKIKLYFHMRRPNPEDKCTSRFVIDFDFETAG